MAIGFSALRAALAGLAALACSYGGIAPEVPTFVAPRQILFVGNSLTEVNDLPHMVEALAVAGGTPVAVEAVTRPGMSLTDLWDDGRALAAIDRRGHDVVVLQQGPSSEPESRVQLVAEARRWADRIRAAGGRPAFYMVWPPGDQADYMDAVAASYRTAAETVHGLLIPAGLAWQAAWRRDRSLPLYGPDRFHPSVEGTYLAALTTYAVLFERSPRGLPARLQLAGGGVVEVPEGHAALLQAAAQEAVEREGNAAGMVGKLGH
jgi:lysophospholipase L1-like esterase